MSRDKELFTMLLPLLRMEIILIRRCVGVCATVGSAFLASCAVVDSETWFLAFKSEFGT